MEFFYSKEMILISLATLGSIACFDEIYFHQMKNKMLTQSDCKSENYLHLIRSFVFSVIFILISSFWLGGAWAIFVLFLFFIDIFVSIGDILVEKRSRKTLGGLSTGEYLTHMLLSFHLGILYLNLIPKLLEASLSSSSIQFLKFESFTFLNFLVLFFGLMTFLYSICQLIFLRKKLVLKRTSVGHL
tara:strand:- start:1222 stop:1782 length:561 start_codon:yes stop_codon:yes gene_type:complete